MPYGISFSRDIINKEIKIYTDVGRAMRPLFIVDKGNQLRISSEDIETIVNTENGFTSLMKEGKIEFIDVEEEECSMIAMRPSDLNNENI